MSDWDGVDRRKYHRTRWLLLLAWCIAFTLITFFSLIYLRELNEHDQEQIQRNKTFALEIQRSRVQSCEQTYATLQTILRAIYLNRPLRPIQRERFRVALTIADPAKCERQTNVTGGP